MNGPDPVDDELPARGGRLGVIGDPMCRNVAAKHGGLVTVFDVNDDAVKALQDLPVHCKPSASEVAASADVIFLSLPGGAQVRTVSREAIVGFAARGTIVVDLSTTAVSDAREIALELAEAGFFFADAPVARTREAAQRGELSIMVGASIDIFSRIKPLLRYMGTDVRHCGEVGCGQVVKLINNTLLFEHVVALGEMMIVAERERGSRLPYCLCGIQGRRGQLRPA